MLSQSQSWRSRQQFGAVEVGHLGSETGSVGVHGLLINDDGQKCIGVLVGGQQPGPGRVDCGVARLMDLSSFVSQAGLATGGLVEGNMATLASRRLES